MLYASDYPALDRQMRCGVRSETQASAEISDLLERVDLQQDGIRVSLKLPMPTPTPTRARPSVASNTVVTKFFPMRVKRRGVEMQLIVEGASAPTRKADPALLTAIRSCVRHGWNRLNCQQRIWARRAREPPEAACLWCR